MPNPFDPRRQLAAYLHPRLCGEPHADLEPWQCLVVVGAIDAWIADFRSAGLVAVPVEVVGFVVRQFDAPLTDPIEHVAAEPGGIRADLYHAQTFVEVRQRDGSTRRLGPWPRWLAEIMLVDLNWSHDEQVVGARLVAEPAWIGELLRGDAAA